MNDSGNPNCLAYSLTWSLRSGVHDKQELQRLPRVLISIQTGGGEAVCDLWSEQFCWYLLCIFLRDEPMVIFQSNPTDEADMSLRFFQVFTEYFKELEEESIQDNFVVVYELLDELMDFGFPQTTDSKILQEWGFSRCTQTRT